MVHMHVCCGASTWSKLARTGARRISDSFKNLSFILNSLRVRSFVVAPGPMTMKLALMLSVVVVALQHSCLALDNGVARLPP